MAEALLRAPFRRAWQYSKNVKEQNMRSICRSWLLLLVLLGWSCRADAQAANRMNFQDRQAIVINNVPKFIELNGFEFENGFNESRFRLETDLRWQNTSSKPITAFEVVILKYDPFNRPISGGGRWMITGHSSGDWTPLMPGQSAGDGLISFDTEPVFTAIAFVRAIRFADGNVWTFDEHAVEQAIHDKLPVLKDLGDVNPMAEPTKK